MSAAGLAEARRRMVQHGESEEAVLAFERSYAELEAVIATGSGGTIPESSIDPLIDVRRWTTTRRATRRWRRPCARSRWSSSTAGSGPRWGSPVRSPPLVVKDELSFLDVIARQTLALRTEYGVQLPLILMNSFRTSRRVAGHPGRYPDLEIDGLPLDFLQSAEPKLRADDLSPVDWPADPELEWCPPGHGDVYSHSPRPDC